MSVRARLRREIALYGIDNGPFTGAEDIKWGFYLSCGEQKILAGSRNRQMARNARKTLSGFDQTAITIGKIEKIDSATARDKELDKHLYILQRGRHWFLLCESLRAGRFYLL